MESRKIIEGAQQALFPIFAEIDAQVQENLRKILRSFREHRLGVHHFASVTGYGHNDLGREIIDQIFAQIMEAEAALVRVQIVSGTHAIACALFGVLRPGNELLAVTGSPYDTLEEVIGIRGQKQGSLRDWGVKYRELSLTPAGKIDWHSLSTAIRPETRLVLIQRSCGYSWRDSLSLAEIKKIIEEVKKQNPQTICFVDNCYGEFVGLQEPTELGADLIAGSLIKNPGGTIVTAGGYLAGKAELIEAAACRLTAPGIGSHGGATFSQNRLLLQGLFLAPQMVGEAIKSSHLIASVLAELGYEVNPVPLVTRKDVIQGVKLGSPEKLKAFCAGIQSASPVGAYLEPVPAPMPGYDTELVMAGGTFIDGSTSELSADGPLREPYIAFCQGGTHWTHTAIALEGTLDALRGITGGFD